MALSPTSSHGGSQSGITVAGPVTVTAANLNAPTDSYFAIWTPPAHALLLDILIRLTVAWNADPPSGVFYDGNPATGASYGAGSFINSLAARAIDSDNGAGSVESGVVEGGGGLSVQLPALLGATPAPVSVPTISGLETPSTTGVFFVWFLYYVAA